MSSLDLPFLANSPGVTGTITRFAVVDCRLDWTANVAALKVTLAWVLHDRLTGTASDDEATPWQVTFYTRDAGGQTVTVAVRQVSSADAAEDRDADGRRRRFRVEVEFELPIDRPRPHLEATIRRVECKVRSPQGDMIGYADSPSLDAQTDTFAADVTRWLQGGTPEPSTPRPPTASSPRSVDTGIGEGPQRLEPLEPVDCAVFCPPTVARATSFLAQLFVYPPSDADSARVHARDADATAVRRGGLSLPADLPLGTRIDLRLEMPHLLVDEPDAVIVWRGTLASVQFEVAVPAGAPLGPTIGRVRFSIAGVPAGTLRFQVAVATVATDDALRAADIAVRRYRRAFVSYSSQDRAEVLRRVQAFRIAGLSVFQDVLDLEPGERWERELYREIDNCDVLLLFWSRAAAASPWVAKEIDYALARKQGQDDRPPDIAPVPIEGPPVPAPPEKLRHLHFNDALLAHIAAAGRQPHDATTADG